MSDWQPGDLALCVSDVANPFWGKCVLKRGRVYVVSGLDIIRPHRIFGPSLCLFLEGVPEVDPGVGWSCRRFRKITPSAKIEGIEEPRRLPVKERQDA